MNHSRHSELAVQADEQKNTDKTVFGFWVYLMTDCVLFATLFATFAVLRQNTFGGPSGQELFDLNFVLIETLILLASSFTCGLAVLAAHKKNVRQTVLLLGVTFLLGATFLAMELYEFSLLIHEGNSWQRSGFLSAYFTLVGTHGLHIIVGLLWLTLLIQHIASKGFTPTTTKRIALFSLFWHFLDIIWIFIFIFVYLAGGL